MNAVVKEKTLIKLDLGCGTQKQPGHVGMDAIAFDGVDIVHHLGTPDWPIEENSVESAHCSHVLEHLTNFNDKWERVIFFNEAWRAMIPNGELKLIIPHWCSNRYYGDPTHKEPLSEMAFYYLDPKWREQNAPHTDAKWALGVGYKCHWACSWDYSLHPGLAGRSPEYVQFAATYFKEAAQDIIVTMKAVKDG